MNKYAQAIYEKAHEAADALYELVNKADEKLIDLQCTNSSQDRIYALLWDGYAGQSIELQVKAIMVSADTLWVLVDQNEITYRHDDFLSEENDNEWYSLDGMSDVALIPTVYNICESIDQYIG